MPLALGGLALVAGALAAWHYASAGLTLSHYDAKGHLVVARRILDSLNPGWVQIGAVWLPLPHLLNMIPVQIDAWYRSGFSAVAISVLSFAGATTLIARVLWWATGSPVAVIAGSALFLASPDVLYLQSTPMTEPLLMALALASVWFTIRASEEPSPRRIHAAGLALAAACLTRYEAWPITAALLGVSLFNAWRERRSFQAAVWPVARMAFYPLGAIAGFLVLGRVATGAWFTSGGFYVPDNIATGRPVKAIASVWWGAHELTSYMLASLALAGLVLAGWVALRDRARGSLLAVLALAASAALPAYAFYAGHPFRIRYMVPLVPAIAIGLGLLVGLVSSRLRWAAAALAAVALMTGPRPLAADAPMVLEAQWDGPNRMARQAVAAHLRQHWDGEPVLASMGSLAHFMQELSHDGFRIRDFLHEGTGPIWQAAFEDPAAHVTWILIEERAEGGDAIAQRARARPRYLDGFDRVAEGGGVALYRRVRNGA